MAESPETPTPSLAERLEADAERWDLDHCCSVDVADLRAAVAQLRQLDRIKAALPPDEIIDRMVNACRNVQEQGRPKNVEWFDWVPAQLERLRDALEADDGA